MNINKLLSIEIKSYLKRFYQDYEAMKYSQRGQGQEWTPESIAARLGKTEAALNIIKVIIESHEETIEKELEEYESYLIDKGYME